MGTTTEELKKLYAKLGGADPNIPKASTPGEVLNGLNELELGGDKLPEVTEADNGKALGVKQGKWDKMDVDIELPDVTTDDNGKVLMVSEGNWGKGDLPDGLPTVTTDDNGKVLMVNEGNWDKGDLPSSDGFVKYNLTYNYNYSKLLLPGDKKISDVINDIRNKKVVLLQDPNEKIYTVNTYSGASISFTSVNKHSKGIIVNLLTSDEISTNSFTTLARTISDIPLPNTYDVGKILSVDSNGNYVLNVPKTWSTTEHIVGKWIDGTTKVYERSYHAEDLSGAPSDWESMFEVNVAEIVHTEGSAHKSNGEVISIENTGFRVCANPQVHPGYMCYHFTDTSVTSFTITVQYTKATS